VQLDVHTQVVGVELELVAFANAAILRDVQRQRATGPSTVNFQCRYRDGSVR
jgi:hypothetical protein